MGLRKTEARVATSAPDARGRRQPVPGPSMRFVLVDRITELQPGQSLVAVKNLSLAEEYLADHFPGFPVMPGVLMLEALTQAGAWLVRDMEDFAHSVVVLKKAKTIKYGSFVEPGRQLQLRVDAGLARRPRGELQGGGDDRRPGDGQGPVHPDAVQPPRPRPGPAHDRRLDRRRPPRPLRDAPQGSVGARAMVRTRSRRPGRRRLVERSGG